MHELGVLGRYLPEWGALTCLVQYDVYHKFTADQHSLLAVENLEALAPGQSAESEGTAEVLNEVERPDVLMLGMLLHDIGKGKGHGHVAKGIPLIEELTARIGLDPGAAEAAVFLVAHHLTMSHIAQRRDIDDPKTIESLAEVARTPERLRMLYLLTYADMRAVGPGVMTGWQARILWELFTRTMSRLSGGRLERPSREPVADRVLEQRGRTARAAPCSRTWRCSPTATSSPPPPSASPPTCRWSSGWTRTWRPPSSSTIPTSAPPSWSSSPRTCRASSR